MTDDFAKMLKTMMEQGEAMARAFVPAFEGVDVKGITPDTAAPLLQSQSRWATLSTTTALPLGCVLQSRSAPTGGRGRGVRVRVKVLLYTVPPGVTAPTRQV